MFAYVLAYSTFLAAPTITQYGWNCWESVMCYASRGETVSVTYYDQAGRMYCARFTPATGFKMNRH